MCYLKQQFFFRDKFFFIGFLIVFRVNLGCFNQGLLILFIYRGNKIILECRVFVFGNIWLEMLIGIFLRIWFLYFFIYIKNKYEKIVMFFSFIKCRYVQEGRKKEVSIVIYQNFLYQKEQNFIFCIIMISLREYYVKWFVYILLNLILQKLIWSGGYQERMQVLRRRNEGEWLINR